METHPIPQNVTSFQFKLVGDMTLKQFLYLAAGVVIAYFTFILFARDYPFISWPVIVISVISGASFAFLPIESRPLDYWAGAFFKAVYSPTKRVWKKDNKTYKDNPLFNSRLVMYLAGINQIDQNKSDRSESQKILQPAQTDPGTQAQAAAALTVVPLPSQEELKKTVDLARQAQNLQMKIIQTERTLSQIKTAAQKPFPIPVDYSQQVNQILTDLQNLVSQASAIKKHIQDVQQPQIKGPPADAQIKLREKLKVIIPPKAKQTTVALTTFPNVINGIVKDRQNNYLEGTVVVIYDKEGLPVRALKTNKLGQFTGSTPLSNGTYTLELEKDGFTFDVLQIELGGEVLPPLLITAKG